LTEYGYHLRGHEFAKKEKLAINGPFSDLKQFLINPNIWVEEVARIAQGPGFDQVTDPPYVIYLRIRAALAHDAEKRIKAFYFGECGTNVDVYISDEARCDEILRGQAMHFTDCQRYEFMRIQFAHKTGEQLAVRDFDVQHPLPEEKTLANMHIWMIR
jgi:hypothetical protein